MMIRLRPFLAAFVAIFGLAAYAQAAPIVFANFNSNEGPFNVAPNFSGTSVGESSLSTADRVTTQSFDPFGTGSQRLEFKHDGSTTQLRIRHLAGSGAPTNTLNTPFNTTAGTDGFIGFYLKVESMTGTMQVEIGLDGPEQDGGVAKNIIADGQWHLYEWNLDNGADWDNLSGIGGDSPVEDGSHTIDSIMFHTGGTGAVDATKVVMYLDFVAKTDSGSVATLIPEPTSLAFLGLGAVAMLRRRRHV